MAADTAPVFERATPSRWRTGFWALIVTQFQGAFSENALKNLIIFIIFGLGLSATQKNQLVPIVMVLFALPFIIFSMLGGYFADRFSKRTVTIGTKLFEIGSASCALAGLALQNFPLEFLAIFLLDTQGAVFGPSKYGLLPEILSEENLSWGNGFLELGTFLAVITGTIAAGFLSDIFRGRQQWSGVILIALALFGTLTSLAISRVPAANPRRKFQANFVAEVWREISEIRKDRLLWLAVLGNTYFWFLGALLQPTIILYGKDVLHLSDAHNGFLQAALAIGIGAGSVAAGYLSGGKIEYGLVPLGAFGLTIFSIPLAAKHLSFGPVLAILAVLGFFGGFFAVPVNALIQYRPEIERRGAVLATAGVLSFVAIGPIAASAYYLLLVVFHLSAAAVFLIGSGLTLVATVSAIALLPDSLLRLLLWLATHSFYSIRVEGRAGIPERGGALFLAGQLSAVDALLLYASTDRRLHFLVDRNAYENSTIRRLAKILKAIPVSPGDGSAEGLSAIREAQNTIRAGEVLCIAAAGQFASADSPRAFAELQQELSSAARMPIVEVSVHGAENGPLCSDSRHPRWQFPRRFPCRVTVLFAPPQSCGSPAARSFARSQIAGEHP